MKIHFFAVFLLLVFSIGCARLEKANAQDNKHINQLPPQDMTKYNKLGLELCNAVGSDDLEGALNSIRKGADINYIWISGDLASFPLYTATHRENAKMVKLLIDSGAKVNFYVMNNFSCLMDAAVSGNLEIAKILLDNSAKVNAKDIHGQTALVWATKFDRLEMVEFLINNGADVNLKDEKNNTALTYAEENKNTAIINALKAAGAREFHL